METADKIEGNLKSWQMRLNNADKAKLSTIARQVYLQGLTSLSRAEEFVTKGNGGKGFSLPGVIVVDNVRDDNTKKRKRGKKKQG